jgi:lipopolysaccharide biosynthesis glycosyltransferase
MKTTTVETVNQLIDEVRAMKTPAEVLAAALAGLRDFAQNGLLHFFAGRAFVQLGEPEDAIRHLALCRKFAPRHHWAAYELARAQALAERPAEALEALGEFLHSHSQPLGAVQAEWCEKVLDKAFESGPRGPLAPLYRRIVDLGSARYLSVLRAFEGAVEVGDLAAAGELLPRLGTPRDAWSHLAVGRFHAQAGDASLVEQHALAASEAAPEHPIVAIAAAEQLARVGRVEALAGRLAQWRAQGRLPAPELALVETILAAKSEALLPDLALAVSSTHATRWPFIAYLYAAGDRLPDDRAELYGSLRARFPADGDLLMCLANLEAGRREFARALAFSREGLAAAGSEALQRGFRFKLFELACFTRQLDEAAALLEQIDTDGLDTMQRAAVARYHAERGQWQDALESLKPLLAMPAPLSAEHALLIVRAARKLQGQPALLQALGPGAAGEGATGLLAGALFEDWLTGSDVPPDAAVETARRVGLQPSPLLEYKLAALAPATHAALRASTGHARPPRRAVFFCADKAYVLPALVSLSSLLHHNAAFAGTRFFIVVDDELMPLAEAAMRRLGEHFEAELVLQPASELVPHASRLGAGYGLFTGGQQLAVAAYYRIYMAHRLARSGEFDQLLYIDSDTVIGDGFGGLLDEPVPEGALLMARLEVARPEVRQAIAQHGLPEGMYFNSGVLWFPRVGEAVAERLGHAIEAAEQRGHELLFQDQCALNIGFAGAFSPLPERYNFFAGPHDAARLQRTPSGEVSMLHVLDRPKPWDSAYPRGSAIQQRWLQAAQALRRAIGADAADPLLKFTVS